MKRTFTIYEYMNNYYDLKISIFFYNNKKLKKTWQNISNFYLFFPKFLIIFQNIVWIHTFHIIFKYRYFGGLCRRDIRVQRPRKPPSNEFRLTLSQFPVKLSKMTLRGSPWTPGTSEGFAVAIFVFSDLENHRVVNLEPFPSLYTEFLILQLMSLEIAF